MPHRFRVRAVAFVLATGVFGSALYAGDGLFSSLFKRRRAHCTSRSCQPSMGEGEWYWHRDPIEERRRTVRIYNIHCVRCHGVSGRGAWDIPDVPDFTNARWQSSRSDGDLARLTLSGRGACMPAFKGTITHEEAWALARYLRTFAQPVAERPGDEDGGD